MKTLSTLVVALLSAVVVSAGAAPAGPTRAEVVAELSRARASGELAELNSEDGSISLRRAASTKTRAQVVAELKASRDSGELALLQSEDPTNFTRVAEVARRQQLVIAKAK